MKALETFKNRHVRIVMFGDFSDTTFIDFYRRWKQRFNLKIVIANNTLAKNRLLVACVSDVIYGKNGCTERFKILTGYRSKKWTCWTILKI